jgi:hypothetical protein
LLENPVGSLVSPAFFRAKPKKMCFYKEVVLKQKFPNNTPDESMRFPRTQFYIIVIGRSA